MAKHDAVIGDNFAKIKEGETAEVVEWLKTNQVHNNTPVYDSESLKFTPAEDYMNLHNTTK